MVDLHVGNIREPGTITYERASLSHPTCCFISRPQHHSELQDEKVRLAYFFFFFLPFIIVVISGMGTLCFFCVCPAWIGLRREAFRGPPKKGLHAFPVYPSFYLFFSHPDHHAHSTDPEPQCRCITIFLLSFSHCLCIPCNGER